MTFGRGRHDPPPGADLVVRRIGRLTTWHGPVTADAALVVADGTETSRRRLELVLTNDPATGVIRHADAGYDIALDTARDVGVRMPLESGTHPPTWQA